MTSIAAASGAIVKKDIKASSTTKTSAGLELSPLRSSRSSSPQDITKDDIALLRKQNSSFGEEFPTVRECADHIRACGCLALIAYFMALYVCVFLAIVRGQLDSSGVPYQYQMHPNNYFVPLSIAGNHSTITTLLVPFYTRATVQSNSNSSQAVALQLLSAYYSMEEQDPQESQSTNTTTPLEELFALATLVVSLHDTVTFEDLRNVCEETTIGKVGVSGNPQKRIFSLERTIGNVRVRCNPQKRISSLVLTNIEVDHDDNDTTITIPPELELLTELKEFMVQKSNWHGNLTSILPPQLTRLSKLEVVKVQDCGLSGTLPAYLGDWTSLSSLSLDNNHITGTFPENWLQLSSHLQQLDLSNNELSGSIPSELALLTELRAMYLENNQWSNKMTPPDVCWMLVGTLWTLGHADCEGIACPKDCRDHSLANYNG